MSVIYDNWERLVTATLRREQLRETGLRTPSDLSLVSASPSSSFNLGSRYGPVSSFSSWSLLVGDSFTYHQILEATDYFNNSKLVKHGHSGDLYLGVLESGTEVLVKRVNVSSLEQELCLMSEMEICGMVNHSRLIPLLGHCLENADEKFLVYKYMRKKDLSRFLSGKINDDRQSTSSLDWTTRLKIATEAAEGLCYLHHECFPPLVHRDIQASSILLDDDFEVRLGSLTEACIEEKNKSQNRIARFLQLPMRFQQSNSGASNATCAYDVYSFGKVLLELVTGKLGISAANDSTMKDWMANTLRSIVSHDKKLIANIVDSSLILDEHILMEVWAVAFVAKACLSPKPSKRPKIAEILKALERNSLARLIGRELKLGGRTASRDHGLLAMSRSVEIYPKGVILSHPSFRIFTFQELEDATRNFGKESWLGQDEFGRVYRGLLRKKSMSSSGTESPIAVKRMNLKSVEGFQQWQAEVELLGRISHPNILKPLGYCWDDNELLLVYEFMQEGSLKKYLFRKGPAIQPLTWERRLKISIGAAKGLAFLHALERQGLFHHKKERGGFYGYFKCSKILIDSDYNAKITGFCVAEVDPPHDVFEEHPLKFRSRVDEYAAPEYKVGGNSLLESDVYGFGVVLVRLFTGEETLHYTLQMIELEMDPWLEGKVPFEATARMALLAQLCVRDDHKLRPSMERVVQILEGIEKIQSS